MQNDYKLYWTRDVTAKSFKVSKETFKNLDSALKKFSEVRSMQRGENPADNAIFLAHRGKMIEERGNKDLIQELNKEMRKSFAKKLIAQEETKEEDPVKNKDADTHSELSQAVSKATPGEHRGIEQAQEMSIQSATENTLREIRHKFQQANIYIHPCNSCHEVGQMLHVPKCVFCGHQNFFFDKEMVVDP